MINKSKAILIAKNFIEASGLDVGPVEAYRLVPNKKGNLYFPVWSILFNAGDCDDSIVSTGDTIIINVNHKTGEVTLVESL